MPQNIPMPDQLSFFLMIGNDMAEMADHIASSVKDHCFSPDDLSIRCISLVDDSFDNETTLEENLHYSFGEATAEKLRDTALSVIAEKMRETMEATETIQFPYDLTKVRFVIVAGADGVFQLKDLDLLRASLVQEMQSSGRMASVLLCLIANMAHTNQQRQWLLTEAGEIRPEIDAYKKVLILTPQNMRGLATLSTARDMQDVAFPALLLMLNGHEMNDPVRLYTAGYSKKGGTSNDILELKRHIAAEALEGYFGNPHALTKTEIWDIFSTEDVSLTEGTSLSDRVMRCAEKHIPQLRHLALTADLEDKDFDPLRHIRLFDEANREKMSSEESWPERWLAEVKEKLEGQVYLDSVLYYLDPDNPEGVVTEILETWNNTMIQWKALQKPFALEQRMQGVSDGGKKGLFEKWQNHNLRALHAALDIYTEVCKERIAYRIMNCLRKGLDPLRDWLKAVVENRRKALQPYMMPRNKYEMLTTMCASAAQEMRSSYSQQGMVEKLPEYIQYREELYRKNGRSHWSTLYREFLNRGRKTSSFSEAFVTNESPHGAAQKIGHLREDTEAMLPSYPDELGALPQPRRVFLVNQAVGELLGSELEGSQVYTVPGDLMEFIALYPLSTSLNPLARLTVFQPSSGLFGSVGSVTSVGRKPTKKSQTEHSNESKAAYDLNPWNIKIKETPKGMLLSWEYPEIHDDSTIRINGSVIKDNYSYADYKRNGRGFYLDSNDILAGSNTVEIDCGDEQLKQEISFASPVRELGAITFGGHKARSNGVEFTKGTLPGEDSENQCLCFADDKEAFLIPFSMDEEGRISPLWCLSLTDELVLKGK